MYGVMVWINVRMNMDMVWSDCIVSKKLDVKLLKVWNHGRKYECMVVMVWINDVQCMKTNMVWYHTSCMYEQNSRFGKKYEIIPSGMMFSPVFFWCVSCWHVCFVLQHACLLLWRNDVDMVCLQHACWTCFVCNMHVLNYATYMS